MRVLVRIYVESVLCWLEASTAIGFKPGHEEFRLFVVHEKGRSFLYLYIHKRDRWSVIELKSTWTRRVFVYPTRAVRASIYDATTPSTIIAMDIKDIIS